NESLTLRRRDLAARDCRGGRWVHALGTAGGGGGVPPRGGAGGEAGGPPPPPPPPNTPTAPRSPRRRTPTPPPPPPTGHRDQPPAPSSARGSSGERMRNGEAALAEQQGLRPLAAVQRRLAGWADHQCIGQGEGAQHARALGSGRGREELALVVRERAADQLG